MILMDKNGVTSSTYESTCFRCIPEEHLSYCYAKKWARVTHFNDSIATINQIGF